MKYFRISADLFDTVFSLGINYAAYVKHKRELEENYQNHHNPYYKPKASFDWDAGFKFGPLGLHNLFSIPILNWIYVPLLMLVGKIAKYCIGYPIGIILGGIAAIILNPFKALIQREEAPSTPATSTPTSALRDHTPTPTPEEQLALRVFSEKKDVLQRKLISLTQLVDNEIARLNPLCTQHEQVIRSVDRLTSKLRSAESEKYAEKFSHYQIQERTIISSCRCGAKARMGNGYCGVCNTPMLCTIQEQIPVYLPIMKEYKT